MLVREQANFHHTSTLCYCGFSGKHTLLSAAVGLAAAANWSRIVAENFGTTFPLHRSAGIMSTEETHSNTIRRSYPELKSFVDFFLSLFFTMAPSLIETN